MIAAGTPPGKTWDYTIYGLRLRCDTPISALTGCAGPHDRPDVWLRFMPGDPVPAMPPDANVLTVSPGLSALGEPHLSVWSAAGPGGRQVCVRHAGDLGSAGFVIGPGGFDILVSWAGVPFDDVVTYLLGTVLGLTLRVRGATSLHAGVVTLDGRAVAVIGGKGAGKSTTTAALAALGYPVLSDDIAALAETPDGWLVSPGYPQLRLYPDSVALIPGLEAAGLPRVLSIADKRFVPLRVAPESAGSTAAESRPWQFRASTARLGAVFLLAERCAGPVAEWRRVPGAEALMTLVSNVYPDYPVSDLDAGVVTRSLVRVAAQVPVFEVRLPSDPGRLLNAADSLARLARELPTGAGSLGDLASDSPTLL